MSMIFKTRISSNIVNFPYDAEIKDVLESFLKDTVNNLDNIEKNDWTIVFQITPSSTYWLRDYNKNVVGVFEKGITYSKDKERIFTLIIPIPNQSEINWGLPKKNYAPRPLVEPEKYILRNINFCDYKNLNEYITACFILGVRALLEKGIVINKNKYKI